MVYKVHRIIVDNFDFRNLFEFGRISQSYIIFQDIYVIQICGIWRRLFESTNQLSSFLLALIKIGVSTVHVSPPLCVWQPCARVLVYVTCTCIFVYRGDHTAN